MGQKELEELAGVVRSGQLGRHGGTKVKELERRFAERYGVEHAIAVSSGSAAVHTAIATIDPNPGDEIITTPCSDFGTIMGVLFQNAIPVFADLDPETFCLDPASVEARITGRTRAIVAVHLFGGLANMDALLAIGERHGIPVIEDCAQVQLSTLHGRLAGTMGTIGCSAVALAGLRRLEENVAARRRAAERIHERVAGLPGLTIPRQLDGAESSYWILHLLVDDSLDAAAIAAALRAEGVPFSAKYVTPLYTWPVLRDKRTYGESGFPFDSPYTTRPFDYAPGLCPVFERQRERLILISLDEQWTDRDADDVAAALVKVFTAFTQRRAADAD
jgi:dTDP-4-amino-4,6-dideoxygalactose transaminase